MKPITSLLLAIFLGACAAPPPAPEPQVPPGQGLLYFYREAAFEGEDSVFLVKENGNLVGGLRNGSYFYHYAPPGRHYYAVMPSSSEHDEDTADGQFVRVVAGQSHYVQAIAVQTAPNDVRAQVFVKYRQQALPVIERLIYRAGD